MQEQSPSQLHVYVWNDPRENNCNSIVVDGKVPLLIDPGHLHRIEELKGRMRAEGVDPNSIKTVICTHAHPDHFDGTRAFHDSKVKIGVSREEETFIEEVGRPMYLQRGAQMPEYRVDFYLKEGSLVVGKHEFQVFLTPGHSPGGICIYWPRYRILFSGDLVFYNGVGRSDLPGGDPKRLKDSIEKMSNLPISLLVPGHGPPVQGEDQVRANFDYVKKAFLSFL